MVAENYMVTAGTAPMRSTVTLSADIRRGAVTAQPVNPVLDPESDTRVMAHPDFSFSLGAAWAKTLRSAYDFTPFYFTSNQASAPRSILPLMEVNGRLTGRRGVALPFTDFCGPLGADAAAVGLLIQNALEFEKSRGWKSVEFRGGGEHFGNTPASLGFCGHSLKLEAEEDLMFARLEGPNGVRFTRPKKTESKSWCFRDWTR